jgi:hypothetical protein
MKTKLGGIAVALAVTGGAVIGMGSAHASNDDAGYDMTAVCRAKSEHGREFAIDLVRMYYGVSESTAVRVVGDC